VTDRLDCVLEVVDALPPVIPSSATFFYHDGRLRVSAAGSILVVEVDGLCVSVADLDRWRMQVYALRDWARETWTLQHFGILPLVLEFLRLRGLYPIHAAALERDGQALLLPALPGGGKTTLAISLVRAGLRLLSDDSPLLCYREGKSAVLGFPEDINVCRDGIGFFNELSCLADRASDERGKVAFSIEQVFPGSLTASASPCLLVFPRVAHQPTSLLQPIGSTDAFHALLEHSLPPLNRRLATAHFATVLDAVASCSCYRLDTGQDPNEAAQLLVALLAERGSSVHNATLATVPAPRIGAQLVRPVGQDEPIS